MNYTCLSARPSRRLFSSTILALLGLLTAVTGRTDPLAVAVAVPGHEGTGAGSAHAPLKVCTAGDPGPEKGEEVMEDDLQSARRLLHELIGRRLNRIGNADGPDWVEKIQDSFDAVNWEDLLVQELQALHREGDLGEEAQVERERGERAEGAALLRELSSLLPPAKSKEDEALRARVASSEIAVSPADIDLLIQTFALPLEAQWRELEPVRKRLEELGKEVAREKAAKPADPEAIARLETLIKSVTLAPLRLHEARNKPRRFRTPLDELVLTWTGPDQPGGRLAEYVRRLRDLKRDRERWITDAAARQMRDKDLPRAINRVKKLARLMGRGGYSTNLVVAIGLRRDEGTVPPTYLPELGLYEGERKYPDVGIQVQFFEKVPEPGPYGDGRHQNEVRMKAAAERWLNNPFITREARVSCKPGGTGT